MPLISRFESLESPGSDPRPAYVVEAGQVGFWEDKSIGGFVVAKCFDHDFGGRVFITDRSLTTQSGAQIIGCSPEDMAEDILPGMSYDIEIISADDEYGQLVIQHVMPGGLMNSLN